MDGDLDSIFPPRAIKSLLPLIPSTARHPQALQSLSKSRTSRGVEAAAALPVAAVLLVAAAAAAGTVPLVAAAAAAAVAARAGARSRQRTS